MMMKNSGNTGYENNRKPYNKGNRPYNNRNNGRKFNRRHTIDVELVIPADVDSNICDELLDTLYAAPFEKLSYSLITPRHLIDASVDNTRKTTNVGYINSYDKFSNKFSVTIFDSIYEAISSLSNLRIELDYIVKRDGTLGTITRIKLVGDVVTVEIPEEEPATEIADAEIEPTEAEPEEVSIPVAVETSVESMDDVW